MNAWLQTIKPWFRIGVIIIVTLIALGLRLRAVDLLPID